MAFRDRFRDRSEHVARDGKLEVKAPTPVQPPPPAPLATDNSWAQQQPADSWAAGAGARPWGLGSVIGIPDSAAGTGSSPAGAPPLPGDVSVSGKPRHVKPPLPDFHELALVQFGRRAGQARLTDRQAVLVSHPVMGNYEQHGFRDYLKMVDDYQHHRFGGLGAEDNEEKRKLREARQKMFQYGDAVTSVNAVVRSTLAGGEDDPRVSPTSSRRQPPSGGASPASSVKRANEAKSPSRLSIPERKPTVDALLAIQKRERALMFAENYAPKPVSPRVKGLKSQTPLPTGTKSSVAPDDYQLMSLEEKHRRDLETIARIKKQLNLA